MRVFIFFVLISLFNVNTYSVSNEMLRLILDEEKIQTKLGRGYSVLKLGSENFNIEYNLSLFANEAFLEVQGKDLSKSDISANDAKKVKNLLKFLANYVKISTKSKRYPVKVVFICERDREALYIEEY